MSMKKNETGSEYPFYGKWASKVIAANRNLRKYKNRVCLVIRESKDKKKHVIAWVGKATTEYVQKDFITKITDYTPPQSKLNLNTKRRDNP